MGYVQDLLNANANNCIGDAMWVWVERYDSDKEHNPRIVQLFGGHMHFFYMSDTHVVQRSTYPLIVSRGLRVANGLEPGDEPIIAYDGPIENAPSELVEHAVVNKDLTELIKEAIAKDLQRQP